MTRATVIGALSMLVLIAAAAQAAAQPQDCQTIDTRECVAKKWAALHQAAVEQLKTFEENRANLVPAVLAAAVQEREEATRQASIIAAVDAVEADDSSAAATVRRLAGAIKTSPKGTEAGVVIAPFVLAGSDRLRGLEVTLAALENDVTRTGASYTWDMSPTLQEVWRQPEACPASEARLKMLERPREFYLNACTRVVAMLPATIPESVDLPNEDREQYATRVRRARIACGLAAPPNESAVASLPQAVNLLTMVVEITNRVAAHTDDIVPTKATVFSLSLRQDASELTNWTIPGPTACYDRDGIRAYFQRLYWDRPKRKFALSASWDLFPHKFGFSPDDSRLPRGDVNTAEARADLSYARASTEVSFGVGLGRARSKLSDDLRAYVGPSASIAHAFSLIRSRPLLTTAGALNVEAGQLPPRLVIGLSVAIQRALEKPQSQDTWSNSVKIQPHVDFLVTETLSFRLGIPVEAEIVEREAKEAQPATPTTPHVPAVEARRSLQWTIPVAIIAVLKLP